MNNNIMKNNNCLNNIKIKINFLYKKMSQFNTMSRIMNQSNNSSLTNNNINFIIKIRTINSKIMTMWINFFSTMNNSNNINKEKMVKVRK